jgi:hypothetical protein
VRDFVDVLVPKQVGTFSPETFFENFKTTFDKTKREFHVPVFSGLSWQDCFVLLEIFFMSLYLTPPDQKSGEAREKIVDMTKTMVRLGGDRSELYKNNICTTYNSYILTYYHIWYLMYHQRLEVFSRSWQALLYNQQFLSSYRVLCQHQTVVIDQILEWIYTSPPLLKQQSPRLRVKRLNHASITFGPFDDTRRSRRSAGRFNVTYKNAGRAMPSLAVCALPAIDHEHACSFLLGRNFFETVTAVETVQSPSTPPPPATPLALDFFDSSDLLLGHDYFSQPPPQEPETTWSAATDDDYIFNNSVAAVDYDNDYFPKTPKNLNL